MAAFVTDNAFEIELNKVIQLTENIKKEQTILLSTFSNLPQKEKIQAIQKISSHMKQIQTFLEKSKQQELFNSGIKFKLENLKSKFSILQLMWKKIEKKD